LKLYCRQECTTTVATIRGLGMLLAAVHLE
jgi:hypothetical protein